MNNARLAETLNEALFDEIKARDTYRKIIDRFGSVRPFINIVEAEQRHIELLLPLYEKYAIPLPVEPDASQIAVPGSLLLACQMGVEGELENVAMYDRLIAMTDLPDVIDVLRRLQAASRDYHLPAFKRCADQGGSPGGGQGYGRGRGQGRGMGRGTGRGGRGSLSRTKQVRGIGEKIHVLILQNFLRQSEHYLLNNSGAFQ